MVGVAETRCVYLRRNASKWKEAHREDGGKNGQKRQGSRRTGMGEPLSEPRYRGSNPCLPARQILPNQFVTSTLRNDSAAVRSHT
jgi:hypothetical protein